MSTFVPSLLRLEAVEVPANVSPEVVLPTDGSIAQVAGKSCSERRMDIGDMPVQSAPGSNNHSAIGTRPRRWSVKARGGLHVLTGREHLQTLRCGRCERSTWHNITCNVLKCISDYTICSQPKSQCSSVRSLSSTVWGGHSGKVIEKRKVRTNNDSEAQRRNRETVLIPSHFYEGARNSAVPSVDQKLSPR